MSFDFSFDASGATLTLKPEKRSLLSGLLGRRRVANLTRLSSTDRALLVAVADLKAMASDKRGAMLDLGPQQIHLSHQLLAGVDGTTAEALGLPPLVDLTLSTDVEGIVGSQNFRLRYQWSRNGLPVSCQRTGAILLAGGIPMRLPIWMMEALEIADSFAASTDLVSHWSALGRFREALDPGVSVGAPTVKDMAPTHPYPRPRAS
jgi:hypothetical protein